MSKFFYGGYVLENYTGNATPFTHGNIPRKVVNTLIIAKLSGKARNMEAKIVATSEINSHTKSFVFMNVKGPV